MKALPRNLLYLSKLFNRKTLCYIYAIIFFTTKIGLSQITNYIGNGGFEQGCPKSITPPYWAGLDSNNCYSGSFFSTCIPNVPYNGFTYQYPRHGNSYMISTFFQPTGLTGHLKNRLIKALIKDKIYCVTFYINLTMSSSYGIDGVGIYFSDGSLDTIKHCSGPLLYIQPQIRNPIGNVIIDTLNWIPIAGTFVATGMEKYALIGNFVADAAITKSVSNPAGLPTIWSDYCIDDVSCIPIDLSAWAGNDTTCISGTSVYIGRQRDVGIDEDCMWYQLPNTITAIDTAAGIWVSPTQTSTYVVRQEICGVVKWDTVVVVSNPLGFGELKINNYKINMYPNPADDVLNVECEAGDGTVFIIKVQNSLGEMIREEEIIFSKGNSKIKTDDLTNGFYLLLLKFENQTLMKKFVIER